MSDSDQRHPKISDSEQWPVGGLSPAQQAELDRVEAEAAAAQVEYDAVRAKAQEAAAANARRVRAQVEEREQLDITETLQSIMSLAEKATGLSRDELLRQAADLEPPAPIVADPRTPLLRRMAAAGVPRLHMDNVVEPVECDALQLVREHLRRKRGGILVLAGGKGTRKTGSACWMLSQVEDGVFVEAADLLAIAFDKDRSMLLRLGRARHVVLDELGSETAGDGNDVVHFKRTLTTLANKWYASCAHVVITGNLSRGEFDAYSDRFKDRMDERGRFFTVGGESVRRGMRQHWLDDTEDSR